MSSSDLILPIEDQHAMVYGGAFNPDGLSGYSTSRDGTLRVWDLRDFIEGNQSDSQ